MRINIDLQPTVNIGSGIATFANALIEYLSKQQYLALQGTFCYIRRMGENGINTKIPFRYSYIPYKLVYNRVLPFPLPIPYSWISGADADINLSFTYRIPRVLYSGITVATIHDLIPLKTTMESDEIVRNYWNDIKYTVNHSDYLLTVSEASKKDIMDILNYPEKRIVVIPNGVNYKLFNEKYADEEYIKIKSKYALPSKYILYMGSIRKHKNIENIIKAFALLPKDIVKDFPLVITKGTPELKQLAFNLRVSDYVIFTPFIAEEDKVVVYQKASLFLFISSYEGFGIPIIEAQAAGIPVITSNTSSMPEVAGEAAVLVNPYNINSVSDAILSVLTDSKLQESMVEKGRNNARRYSWDAAGEKLLSFLKEIK